MAFLTQITGSGFEPKTFYAVAWRATDFAIRTGELGAYCTDRENHNISLFSPVDLLRLINNIVVQGKFGNLAEILKHDYFVIVRSIML